MKISKKLVALVAMAAFCCTLVVPVVAKAALTTCPPHYFVQDNYKTVTIDTDHQYLYGIVENADGTKTPLWGTCYVTTVEEYCDRECTKCGLLTPEVLLSKTTTHTSCGQ